MVLKELILTVSTLQGCGSLERTDFNSFYSCMVVAVLKELILTVSTLRRYGSLEKMNLTISTLEGCCYMESPGFECFYFRRVWWS